MIMSKLDKEKYRYRNSNSFEIIIDYQREIKNVMVIKIVGF